MHSVSTVYAHQGYNMYTPMLPKMMPFSVEATLTLALMLVKSCGAMVTDCGFSTSFRSPDNSNIKPHDVVTSLNDSIGM